MCCCGGYTDSATHTQPARPRAKIHNSVNIGATLLIFVALDCSFQELSKNAIIRFFWMDGC